MKTNKISLSCKDFGTFDLAVIGGGCTGVFAAVRAARLGLKVAIIEKSNCFGGVATNSLVGTWHTLLDVDGKEQIIGGLTDEVEQILIKNGNAKIINSKDTGICFDPNALKIVLDDLAVESGIRVFFHTFYNSLIMNDNKIEGIVVGNKDGIGIIYAKFFIDATGDGDLCRDVGLESFVADSIQPPSPTALMCQTITTDLAKLIKEHGEEFGVDDDFGWSADIPGLENINFRADFHVFGKMCNKEKDLTDSEIAGRKKIHAFKELLRKYDNPKIGVVSYCSQIGIRETVHYKTIFKANEHDLLLGKSYDDTIMRGTYRVDVHHADNIGITFKYLTGETETLMGKAYTATYGNWREEEGITTDYARYYQLPFEILVQDKISNLIPVGRMINADAGAFGALRVMVNLNQLGEAAGVGAYLSLNENKVVTEVLGKKVQKILCSGGSIL